MHVTVESSNGLQRKMRVEIPEDRVETEISDRLKSMTRTVKMPGFRPGKVPLKVVARRYGSAVRSEVVGELMRSSFYDAVVKEQLRPAGNPTIDTDESFAGKGVAYTATFEVYPDVEVPSVESLNVVKPIAEVKETDVDNMIETLRKRRQEWEAVERAAAQEDRVVVDFEGRVDGEVFEGGSASDLPVELGAKRMLDGFEDGLVGAQPGEERTLDLRFPDDYHRDDLAAKPVTFSVEVKSVEAARLPEVEAEFIRGFGVESGEFEAFRQEVRANMQRELDEALRSRTKQNIMDALFDGNPVEVPKALVDEEVGRLLEQSRGQFASQGIDAGNLALDPAMFEDQARRRIALGLLLAEVVKAKNLTADAATVRARVESIASTYEDPAQVISWFYGEPSRLAEIESAVLEDTVVEWVLGNARVEDQESSFDELLNPGQTT